MRLRNVSEVAAWRLCTGCGVCASICPERRIRLQDVPEEGIRPVHDTAGCGSCRDCVHVCPGYESGHTLAAQQNGVIPELRRGWGPVLEVWEGNAADGDLHFQGSSGGAASAIALYCLERAAMAGVVHTGMDPEKPWSNRTFISQNRASLLRRTGSRYAPASPGDGWSEMERSPSASVFIGKPCDIAGVRKIQSCRKSMEAKVGLAIALFCGGTPATRGTLELLKRMNIEAQDVADVRYRGKGWPGFFTVRMKDGRLPPRRISYAEAWGFLEAYRPFRCHLCPDGTGELADISCGDPWHRREQKGDPGYSLVLVRTEKGREILRGARETGYLLLSRRDAGILGRSQPYMLNRRQAVWGRILALKAFGIPAPRYKGFHLFRNWLQLSLNEKSRSTLGTVRRIVSRRYFRMNAPK